MSDTSIARAESRDERAPAAAALGPVFIGGLDRCGKTTMRAFLTSHPNIAIPAVGSNMETYFFGRFGDLSGRDNLERCLDAMLRYKHVRFLQPDPDRIRREFLQGPPSYERLFSLFLIHYAEREGKPRWGAQTGLIERYADRLFEEHPGARVVHMVRDPRDRYAASLQRWANGRGRAGGATARWRYSIRLAERNLRRYPDAYSIVRFEDLVRRPEAVLREVCSFLGEAFWPEMLAMPGAPEHRAKLSKSSGRPETAPLSEDFVGGYRDVVPRRELAFMQLHAGRRMRAYGYEPDRLGLSLGDRVLLGAWDWPNQFLRMVTWRGVEGLQQRLPRLVGRTPHARMIVDRNGPS